MANTERAQAQAQLEEQVRAACQRGDHAGAATLLLEALGPKVLAFLLQRLGNPTDASEVFSMFGEDLWRGLPRFEWRCSVRGYCFALARTAAVRFRKRAGERHERRLELSDAPLSQLVESVRERTLAHLRTEVKTQMREIIQRLAEDDRALLSLRIDQNLSFRELAIALEHGGEVPDEEDLTRSAARLRKRFQLIKQRVRQSAREAGLLGEASQSSSGDL